MIKFFLILFFLSFMKCFTSETFSYSGLASPSIFQTSNQTVELQYRQLSFDKIETDLMDCPIVPFPTLNLCIQIEKCTYVKRAESVGGQGIHWDHVSEADGEGPKRVADVEACLRKPAKQ